MRTAGETKVLAEKLKTESIAVAIKIYSPKWKEYSEHVRVRKFFDSHKNYHGYEAVCFTCAELGHAAGPDRKYLAVAVRDAIKHTVAEHGGK